MKLKISFLLVLLWSLTSLVPTYACISASILSRSELTVYNRCEYNIEARLMQGGQAITAHQRINAGLKATFDVQLRYGKTPSYHIAYSYIQEDIRNDREATAMAIRALPIQRRSLEVTIASLNTPNLDYKYFSSLVVSDSDASVVYEKYQTWHMLDDALQTQTGEYVFPLKGVNRQALLPASGRIRLNGSYPLASAKTPIEGDGEAAEAWRGSKGTVPFNVGIEFRPLFRYSVYLSGQYQRLSTQRFSSSTLYNTSGRANLDVSMLRLGGGVMFGYVYLGGGVAIPDYELTSLNTTLQSETPLRETIELKDEGDLMPVLEIGMYLPISNNPRAKNLLRLGVEVVGLSLTSGDDELDAVLPSSMVTLHFGYTLALSPF